MNKKITSLTLLACACAFSVSSAYALSGAQSFWNDSEDGYFWYKDPTLEKKKKVEKKPVKPIAPVVAKTEPKKEIEKTEDKSKPAPMFSALWVKENLEVYKRVAWDNPTPENLRAYLYLQRFAMDRSEEFAFAGQMAVDGDPYLDEIARSPLGGTMRIKRESYVNAEQSHLLKQIYSKVGIFFVFKNNCYMCDEQAEVLKNTASKYNITVKAVALDTPDSENKVAKLFPDYIVNPNIGNQLEIRALPASFLLDASTRQIKPLLQGFVTESDLNRRTITAAQKYKFLPNEAFDNVRPFNDVTSLSGILSSHSDFAKKLETLKEKTNPYGQDTNYVEPSLLVQEILKAKKETIPENYTPRGF